MTAWAELKAGSLCRTAAGLLALTLAASGPSAPAVAAENVEDAGSVRVMRSGEKDRAFQPVTVSPQPALSEEAAEKPQAPAPSRLGPPPDLSDAGGVKVMRSGQASREFQPAVESATAPVRATAVRATRVRASAVQSSGVSATAVPATAVRATGVQSTKVKARAPLDGPPQSSQAADVSIDDAEGVQVMRGGGEELVFVPASIGSVPRTAEDEVPPPPRAPEDFELERLVNECNGIPTNVAGSRNEDAIHTNRAGRNDERLIRMNRAGKSGDHRIKMHRAGAWEDRVPTKRAGRWNNRNIREWGAFNTVPNSSQLCLDLGTRH